MYLMLYFAAKWLPSFFAFHTRPLAWLHCDEKHLQEMLLAFKLMSRWLQLLESAVQHDGTLCLLENKHWTGKQGSWNPNTLRKPCRLFVLATKTIAKYLGLILCKTADVDRTFCYGFDVVGFWRTGKTCGAVNCYLAKVLFGLIRECK